MRKKAKLVRRTPIGNIYHSVFGDLRLELPRDRERLERCYQNSLMHELIFANERYFGGPHDLLFKKLRTLQTIPKEVIEYRIKCLKGKAPAKVPAIVYEYPPPHRGSSGLTDTWATPWWTYPWILPGDKPESERVRNWYRTDPKDHARTKTDEIKSFIKSGLESVDSYENCGRKTHPEYSFITDKRRKRIEALKVILREKMREERAKRRTGKAA